MKRSTILSVTTLSMACIFIFPVSTPAQQSKPSPRKNPPTPEYSRIDPSTLKTMKAEGITEDIYHIIQRGGPTYVRFPVPRNKTGASLKAFAIVAASTENIWEAVYDCESMPTYVPHMAECKDTVSTNPPPPMVYDGIRLPYVRTSKNVIKYPFVTITMFQDVWVSKPGLVFWRRVNGDMKFNEGYWRIIPIGPRLNILIYRIVIDAGRLIPDSIQEMLTGRDLPEQMETMRRRVEEVLEKRAGAKR